MNFFAILWIRFPSCFVYELCLWRVRSRGSMVAEIHGMQGRCGGGYASHITAVAMDRWESILEEVFQGRPFDMLDVALSDTVSKFPVDIQVWISFVHQTRYQHENHC